MANSSSANMTGRIANILAVVGIIGFLLGSFGLAARTVMLVGIALIVASLVGYFFEEYQLRGRF